ncbi:hypothetical protein FOZ62_000227 [Perkinsus olseni]|uniref:Uncharacterized protein n=1 Tax=Perkinsus olseni TaxID=32597 RepID=A0A7J6QLY6_PEROL|nr:hypothetical protein FOZ62_000227 [Perkinsus olseni]
MSDHAPRAFELASRWILEAEEECVYTWWDPGGRDITYEERFGGISKNEIPSRIYVRLPNGNKASNEEYNLRGWANSGQLILHSDASATSHSGEVILLTAQSVQVTKKWFKEEEGWIAGWRYQIYQRVEGYAVGLGPFESFEPIATGGLVR